MTIYTIEPVIKPSVKAHIKPIIIPLIEYVLNPMYAIVVNLIIFLNILNLSNNNKKQNIKT